MEELQSTEVLDHEILEDARKKAYRILKTADETVKANAAAWEKKIQDAVNELKLKYAERRKLAATEIMARLPLDKRRASSERIEGLLRDAEESWYKGLSREKVLSILKRELARRLRECPEFAGPADSGGKAFIRCLDAAEAEAILKELLPGHAFGIEEGAGAAPGIVLESGAVRITASIGMALDDLLHEKRAELAAALLGQDSPEAADASGLYAEAESGGGFRD
jgi:vacuolar-type H+-ATPase subunit E/Vma4